MTAPAHDAAVNPSDRDAIDQHARLCHEIDYLNRLLADLAVEERDAHAELQSLNYAVQLTRGEVERRQRANSELEAPQQEDPQSDNVPYAIEFDTHNKDSPRNSNGNKTNLIASNSSLLTSNSANDNAPDAATSATILSFSATTPPSSRPNSRRRPMSQSTEDVTRLEAQLHTLKQEVATVLFETEDLEASVRRHRAAARDAALAPPPQEDALVAAALTDSASARPARPLHEALSPRLTSSTYPGSGSAGGATPTVPIVSIHDFQRTGSAIKGSDKPTVGATTNSSDTNSSITNNTNINSNFIATTAATANATSPRLGGPKTSPRTRPVRLIGDVDALLAFGDDATRFEPCRLGVSATGQLGVFSYASPAPLLLLDDAAAAVRDISHPAEQAALAEQLVQTDVTIAGATHRMCGLREAVSAALLLVRGAGGECGDVGVLD